jgi:spermidine dehydrogenase
LHGASDGIERIDNPMAGMTDITRRDFLNGVALTIASGLTPMAQIRAQSGRYPPALTGMRGHHAGSFEIGHDLRDGKAFPVEGVPIEERYDLVVVGGGISGLASAWFYRRANHNARVLILDNHDDFGGHAKRNELVLDGRLIIGYGGSESMQSPRALYSAVAKGLLKDLGVDIARFETAFERRFYPSLGLSRGVFFPRETFGRDALATGDPTSTVADDLGRSLLNAKPLPEFVAQFPISAASKAQLTGLYQQSKDPLAGRSKAEKTAILKRTSYRDYLIKVCDCSEEVANCFQGRTLDFFAVGCDAVSAADARDAGYPGFAALGLPAVNNPERSEPYIYHFPDGNASLARLLVRALIPSVAPGSTMDDIVLAPFDYGRLDVEGAPVRIRLDSTCVNVRNAGGGVELAYMRTGKLHRVTASHAVLACFHMVIPYIMPELPPAQREALAKNVKAPLVYTNVLVRNWHPWVKLGVHEIVAPMSIHSRVKLDYPVSLGGYRHSRDPSEPMVIHMTYVPVAPGPDARTQFRFGRAKLLSMEFADFETIIRDELDRMLGGGGFSSARDIAAITVNRWSHGYSYVASTLYDGDDYEPVLVKARQTVGRVAIANTDAGGDAYAHLAIDQAARAVRELMG